MMVEVETMVAALMQRCFVLARHVGLHVETQGRRRERAVAGVVSGLLEAGDEVTWEAVHLGVRQRLTVVIDAFAAPSYFRDTMRRGAFSRFAHEHYFAASGAGTRMRDVLDFASPLGLLGAAVDRVYLGPYLRRLLQERNAMLARLAEGDGWRAYIPA